jgi:hypothetical protein
MDDQEIHIFIEEMFHAKEKTTVHLKIWKNGDHLAIHQAKYE